MSRRQYGRVARLCAIAILVTVPSVALTLLLPPFVHTYQVMAKEIRGLNERRAELLGQQRDLLALESVRDRLKAADPEVYGLLVAETVELARVQIRQQVIAIASRNGATVLQTRAVDSPAPEAASAAINLSIPQDALPPFLVDLANARPIIFVDALNIQREPTDGSAELGPNLSIDLALSSYTLVDLEEKGEQ